MEIFLDIDIYRPRYISYEVYRAVTRSCIMNCYVLPLTFGVILLRYVLAVTQKLDETGRNLPIPWL